VEGRDAATGANVDSEIRVEPNGPYIVANVKHVTDWLGQELPVSAPNRIVPMRAIAEQTLLRWQSCDVELQWGERPESNCRQARCL
jgi:hypothetical protein